MKITVFENAEELSRAAAGLFADLIRRKPDAVLGLATGSTPLGTYRELVRMHREEGLDFSRITSFNLDEYVGLPEKHPQSYHTFMREHLFSLVNIPAENTHIPSSTLRDGAEYDRHIAAAGGIDLQLLGIGRNGHIGFNEPAESLALSTHLAALTDSTRQANARFFDSPSLVPEYAMTMGMGSIFAARHILLLAIGAEKRDAVRYLSDGLISTSVPATLLKLHPNVTLFCDKAAAGK